MNLLIANWKASMTLSRLGSWMDTFTKLYQEAHIDQTLKEKNICIVLCAPFPLLPRLSEQLGSFESLSAGSQHISPMHNGAFTGEVTAEVLKDFVKYGIVGHSERRIHFHLSEEEIQKSLNECSANTITPILCVRNEQDRIYDASIIAYEPVEAIGSGKNADISQVISMKKSLSFSAEKTFLYGGSVDPSNMKTYLETGEVQGFLVGTASLDPNIFFQMVHTMLQN